MENQIKKLYISPSRAQRLPRSRFSYSFHWATGCEMSRRSSICSIAAVCCDGRSTPDSYTKMPSFPCILLNWLCADSIAYWTFLRRHDTQQRLSSNCSVRLTFPKRVHIHRVVTFYPRGTGTEIVTRVEQTYVFRRKAYAHDTLG